MEIVGATCGSSRLLRMRVILAIGLKSSGSAQCYNRRLDDYVEDGRWSIGLCTEMIFDRDVRRCFLRDNERFQVMIAPYLLSRL